MNLFTMTKKELTVLCFAFVAAFALSVTIGLMGPPVLRDYRSSAKAAGADMRLNTTKFVWELSGVDSLNKGMTMLMSLVSSDMLERTVNVVVQNSAWGSTDGVRYQPIISNVRRTREVFCAASSSICEPEMLVHDSYIRFSNYRTSTSIMNGADLPFMTDVRFTYTCTSFKFTIFELWFRGIFVGLGILAIFFYAYKLRDIAPVDWTYEQRWTLLLLVSLVLYNNPLISLEVMVPSWFFTFLDTLFFATFFCLLLMFWLCQFDGIRKHRLERDARHFYIPKIALVGGMWVFMIATLTVTQIYDLSDFTFTSVADLPGYLAIQVIQLLLLLCYIFWLMFVVIRAVAERSTSRFGTRIQVLGSVTAFVIIITVIGLIVNSVSTQMTNAAQFLSFFSLYNLYVYLLAICFMPPSGAAATSNTAKQSAGAPFKVSFDDAADNVPLAPFASTHSTAPAAATVHRAAPRRNNDSDDDQLTRVRRSRDSDEEDAIAPVSAIPRSSTATAAGVGAAPAAKAPTNPYAPAPVNPTAPHLQIL